MREPKVRSNVVPRLFAAEYEGKLAIRLNLGEFLCPFCKVRALSVLLHSSTHACSICLLACIVAHIFAMPSDLRFSRHFAAYRRLATRWWCCCRLSRARVERPKLAAIQVISCSRVVA